MAIVVQKYGGSSVADVQKLRHVAERVMRPDDRGTTSWSSCPRWATRPTICWPWRSRSRRTPIGASSTCCSPPASASRWRCSRWRFASWAATRSASPAASPASSPTTATSTPASSRCGRSACRTSSRAAGSSSSPATRASRTGRKSRRSGAAAATRRRWRWRRRSTPSTARSARTSTASTPPIHAWSRRRGGSATLSYEETQEMAEAGAKVLNAQAVEFAKETAASPSTRARRSGPLPGPDPSSDGTVVRKSPPRMPGTVVGVASERDVILLEGDARPADLLALLDERGVAGKQLHVFGDRTHGGHLAREPPRRGAAARGAADRGSAGAPASSTGWPPSASSAPASTRSYANVRAGSEALAAAGIVPRGHRHVVVSHHLDGPARPDERRGPRAARSASSKHRVSACRWSAVGHARSGRSCT